MNIVKEGTTMKLVPRNLGYGLDLFDDFFETPSISSFNTRDFMRTDIRENETGYVLDIDLPGFAKENITLELENGYLKVTAVTNTNKEDTDSKGNIIHQERYSGTCSRSYYVGNKITEEDIKASHKDGILTISFPKEIQRIVEKKTISID